MLADPHDRIPFPLELMEGLDPANSFGQSLCKRKVQGCRVLADDIKVPLLKLQMSSVLI